MSTPPGVVVTVGVKPQARSTPTFTGPAFVGVLSDRAPVTPKKMTSLADFPGSRLSSSVSSDWVEGFFQEGGAEAYASVIVGPAAASATLVVAGTSGTAFTLAADDKGEWANGAAGGLTGEIIAGPINASARVLIVKLNSVEIDRTPEYTANQTAIDYFNRDGGQLSATVGGGSGLTPIAAVANFTGGTTDRGSIVIATHVAAALARCTSDLGPGQEALPDYQDDVAHDLLKASAANHSRFAALDTTDTTTKATVLTSAAHLKAATYSDSCSLYTPWLNAPPLATGGNSRAVPPSALVCARMATNDATPGDGPAQSPAGDWGVARWFTGVRATYNHDTVAGVNDAGDLNDAGVNLVIVDDGAVTIDGFRTMVDQAGQYKIWGQVGVVRHRMSLVTRGRNIGKRYFARKFNNNTREGLESDMNALLLADYLNGDIYGDPDDDRPQTAYRIDMDTLNTPENINNGVPGVIVYYRPVKGAEFVQIVFQAVAITDTVG